MLFPYVQETERWSGYVIDFAKTPAWVGRVGWKQVKKKHLGSKNNAVLMWWKDWKKKCELLQGDVLAGRCSAVDHRGWGLTPSAGQCWLQGFEDRPGKASPSRQRPDPQPRRTCTAPAASWFTALWPGCSTRTLTCAAFLQEEGQRLIPSKLTKWQVIIPI